MAATNPEIASKASAITNVAPADETVVVAPDEGKVDSEQYRADFLASFTAEEEKSIMRKVDKRLLLLCGLLFMIKQVSAALRHLRRWG